MIQLNIIATTPNGNRCEYPIEFPDDHGIRQVDNWFDGYDYHLFLDTLCKILAVNEDIVKMIITLEMDENGMMKFVLDTADITIHLNDNEYRFWHRKKVIDDII